MYQKIILITVGRIVQIILTLLTLRLATTCLPPEEMGRMSLLLATTTFLALFLVNPIGVFINRRLHSWQQHQKLSAYLLYYIFYLLIIILGVSFLLKIAQGHHLLGGLSAVSWQWLTVLICGSLLFNTLNQTYIPSLNLLGYYGWFILLSIGTLLASLICAVLLVQGTKPIAEYWALGILFGQIMFAAIGMQIFYHKIQMPVVSFAKLTKTQLHNLFYFSLPIAFAVGCNWVQLQGYRFLMEKYLGLANLGLFVAGYQISAGIFAAFESILSTYFMPKFYARLNSADNAEQSQAWNDYGAALFPSLIITLAFVMVLAPELAKVLLSEQYYTAYHFIIWGALAEFARVAIGVFGLATHAKMKTYLLLLPNSIGAITAFTLAWWLIPQYATFGTGLALSIAGVVSILLMQGIFKRYLQIQLAWIKILFALIIGSVIGVCILYLRKLFVPEITLLTTLVTLSISGLLYLIVQYLLLRPYLQEGYIKQ